VTSPASRPVGSGAHAGDARERIVSTAYDLFCRHGLRAIGIDRIIAEAGIAKMTLYRHFQSKDDLVVAVLERREEVWLRDWLEAELEARAEAPEDRLMLIFDLFDEWFRRDDYEACLFMNSLLESKDRTSSIGAASVNGLTSVRLFLRQLAEETGVRDPEGFAERWQVLMMGSIIATAAGIPDAAQRAREVAVLLLEQEAQARSSRGGSSPQR
jgi:AcrR family transcriptional regulator